MGTVTAELTRAFLAVGVDVIGKKQSRKLLRKMQEWLLWQTPPNAIGPVVCVRKEALKVLSDTLRQIDGEDAGTG